MKATNSSIAKLLLPALLLAFFQTQAGAQIQIGSASRQTGVAGGVANSGLDDAGGPQILLGSFDVGLFNPGTTTSSASDAVANVTVSASQNSNIDNSDPTHLRVTASLSESFSGYGQPVDAQGRYGQAEGQGQSYFTTTVHISEPFTLTLSVTTAYGTELQGFSDTVTLSDNNGPGQIAIFGADTNGTYLQSGTYGVSGAAGDYTLTAELQDTPGVVGGSVSSDNSASFQLDVMTAPEPSSALLLLGSGALLLLRRRRAAV